MTQLSSADHEEADTRILLHAKDASQQGYGQTIIISSVTDVLVLLTVHRTELSPLLWMQTGISRKKRYIPVHDINLPEAVQSSVLAFHAITGSDSTSQFAGIGKQSAWSTFVKHPQLLENLGREDFPDQRVQDDAEAFICKLYDPNTASQPTSALLSLSQCKEKH